MRALVFDQFGGPEVLQVREVPMPVPGPGEVSIRVGAAGLNFFDLQIRQELAGFPIPLPFIGGMEAVGVIETVGEGVEGWKPGDRVMRDVTDSCGVCRYCTSGESWRCVKGYLTMGSVSGGFAEVMTCKAHRLIPIPDGIDDVTAASIMTTYGTAWHMLHTRARLRSADVVLVSSGGSGLGSAAADIARAAGALVIATASTDEKLEKAKARGVDHVINYTRQNVADEVMRITDGVGADIAFEHVGGDAFSTALDSLAIDGRLVTCGWSEGVQAPGFNLMNLVRSRKSIIGSASRTVDDICRVMALVVEGRLRPAIAAVFPLEQGRAAVELSESRTAFGKIVIQP